MKLFSSGPASFIQKEKALTGFTIFVIVLCFLNLLFDNINHKFFVSDFKVYYYAADNLLSGGKVYSIPYGLDSGFYKYSPLTLFFFIPYTLFALKVAAVIHFIILSFSYWYSFILVRRILRNHFFLQVKNAGWLLSLAVLSTLIFLVKELHLANINILLIMLMLMALQYFIEGKDWRGSVLLGLVILTKPFFLILILPLIFRKRITALAGITFTVLSGLLFPFIVLGFQKAFTLQIDWVIALLEHGSGYSSKNSIDYILRYYFWPELPGYTGYLILLSGFLLGMAFILKNLLNEHRNSENYTLPGQNFIIEWFVIMAMVPNISNTDTNLFLNSIPIITFIIYYISVRRKYFLIPVMLILIFFYGGNSQDILGAVLSKRLFYMGLIGLSNLLLIALTIVLYLDFRKTAPIAPSD